MYSTHNCKNKYRKEKIIKKLKLKRVEVEAITNRESIYYNSF